MLEGSIRGSFIYIKNYLDDSRWDSRLVWPFWRGSQESSCVIQAEDRKRE